MSGDDIVVVVRVRLSANAWRAAKHIESVGSASIPEVATALRRSVAEARSALQRLFEAGLLESSTAGRWILSLEGRLVASRRPLPHPSTRPSRAVSARYGVSCPTCAAPAHGPCRSVSGRVTDPHAARCDAVGVVPPWRLGTSERSGS